MCSIKLIKIHDDFIAHESKFDAECKTEARFQKILPNLEIVFSKILNLKDSGCVVRAQVSEIFFFGYMSETT